MHKNKTIPTASTESRSEKQRSMQCAIKIHTLAFIYFFLLVITLILSVGSVFYFMSDDSLWQLKAAFYIICIEVISTPVAYIAYKKYQYYDDLQQKLKPSPEPIETTTQEQQVMERQDFSPLAYYETLYESLENVRDEQSRKESQGEVMKSAMEYMQRLEQEQIHRSNKRWVTFFVLCLIPCLILLWNVHVVLGVLSVVLYIWMWSNKIKTGYFLDYYFSRF